MKTDYQLVEALKAMYHFLGGNSCMQGSGEGSKEHHFRCGASASNDTLINAIVKAATGQGKRVNCEYSGSIVNIEVIF